LRRRWRIRKKITGTKARPRMSVCFTNENIHVQFIDDTAASRSRAASTPSKTTPDREKLKANAASAKKTAAHWPPSGFGQRDSKSRVDRGGAVITGKSKRWRMPREKPV